MVSESRNIITLQPFSVLGPVVAIAVLCVSLNLMADALNRQLTHEETREIVRL
jgi:ABC-type dipeptide/oligopeptide/nickel transport system permease subunit